MTPKTTPWDSAEYLENTAAIAAYIDPALVTHALGVVARAKGMTQLAREVGVTREALYKALSAEGDPKLSTFFGVIKALGVRLAVQPAGVQKLALELHKQERFRETKVWRLNAAERQCAKAAAG